MSIPSFSVREPAGEFPGKRSPRPSSGGETIRCDHCASVVSSAIRHCPSCATDLGFPNVRHVLALTERNALKTRRDAASSEAVARGVAPEFDALEAAVLAGSHVVVTMPADVARKIFSNPLELYTGYESLVEAGARVASPSLNDRHRTSVSAMLFGSYAKEIRYGVLSLNGFGPESYGHIHCQLRDVAVRDRATFLERNSYHFVDEHKLTPDKELPSGFQAAWENRHHLVSTKLGRKLRRGDHLPDFAGYLVVSNPADRSTEEFVEAHINGMFDRNSVEKCLGPRTKPTQREIRVDVMIALERFAKFRNPRN